jgi:hypothetical protein
MLGFVIDSTWSEIMENEDPNHGFNFNCYGLNPLGVTQPIPKLFRRMTWCLWLNVDCDMHEF